MCKVNSIVEHDHQLSDILYADHILTLQHSLAHYERMLSQSHPTYLSQLRVSVGEAKSGQDKAIMLLTIVSMAVLCNQAMIGVSVLLLLVLLTFTLQFRRVFNELQCPT